MKNLKSLLLLFVVALLVTACEKESTQELLIQEPETLEAKMQAEYEAYLAEHGEVQIEYTTLEELNQVYIENGLEPVTLEELGITEEEYRAAQERINNPNVASPRCNAFYTYLIDINRDGFANGSDLTMAREVILGTRAPSDYSQNFGLISYYWAGTGIPLTSYDIAIAQGMILGTYCN